MTLAIGTNPGNGTLSGCTGTTVSGLATFTGCKIDKIGTGYTLTATDAADNLTVPSAPSSPFNITVGPPAQLSFTTSPGTTVGGDAFGTQPVVAIQDAGGNQTTATSTVSLAIGTNPAAGTLSGCTSTTTSGVATFSGCKIDKPGNGYTLVASDGTLQPGTSNPFNIVTAALTSFQVTPAANNQTAGTAFNVTIKGLDQSGFLFPGLTGTQTIAFSGPSNSPNGTAPLYPATVSFAGGVGTASVTLYDAQTTQLKATQGSVTGTSGNITVSALATPVSFTVPNPGTQTAGTPFSETITAADQYGNAATGYANGNHTLTFTGPLNAPNGKAPSYPAQVNFTNGVGTANITLYDAQPSTTLKATATGPNLTGTSTTFTVNPGAPGSFSVTNPGTQTAGTPFNVTITATDVVRQCCWQLRRPPDTQLLRTVQLAQRDAPAYPASVNFTNGVGTASITLYDAQTTSLTVSQNSATGSSGNFTVNGTGTIGSFVLSNIGTQTAGTAFNVTITAADPYGNAATGYPNGNHALTFTGPSNSPNGHVPSYPAQVNFTNGVGTANITLYDAQTTTLTASATGPNLTGTSNSFTVNGRAASAFSITNPGTQTAGTQFNLTITAVDAYGNTDTGYNPPILLDRHPQRSGQRSRRDRTELPGHELFLRLLHQWRADATGHAVRRPDHDDHGVCERAHRHLHQLHGQPGRHRRRHRLGLPEPDHRGHGPQCHGHGGGQLQQRGHRLHRHGPLHEQRRRRPSCRPTTPSSPATTGPTPSRRTLKTAGTQSITATDTVTGTITGTQSGIAVNPARPPPSPSRASRTRPRPEWPTTSRSRPRTPSATPPPATSARSTSRAATVRPSCRPTTPSWPATTGPTPSRSPSRRRAPSRSRPPTR